MKAFFNRLLRRKSEAADCSQVRRLSSDYIEGELPQDAASKVQRHLGLCPPCSAFVSTLMATVRMLRATSRKEAPNSFRQRLAQKLRMSNIK